MQAQLDSFIGNLRWFDSQQVAEIGFLPFLVILLVSLLSSLLISYLYLRFYSSRATGSQVYLAFPLLGISITAIFICIQFSLPLSLGLLGALSIVRFRTPIKEPEEIGFIMLLIAASLACATVNLVFLVIILGVAGIALVVRRFAPAGLGGGTQDGSLIISLPEEEYSAVSRDLFAFLNDRLPRARIDSVTKNESEIVVGLSFQSISPAGLVAVEADLRKLARPSNFTILYNRPGSL